MLSVSSCRTSRCRLAPSAVRIATSFSLPADARQQQVRHVGARNQQHQRHRPEQHQQRPAHVSHHLLLQPHHVHAEGAVALVLLADPAGDHVDIRLRLLNRNSALQPHHDVIVLVPAPLHGIRPQRQRQIHVHLVHRPLRRHHLCVHRELRAKHSRHRDRVPVERDRPADDVRVRVEQPLPQAVAQNRDGRLAGLVLIRRQQAAQQRPGPEHPQQARLRAHSVDQFRLLPPGQREAPGLRQRHLFERVVLVLYVDVLARRRPVAEDSDSRRVQPNRGQPPRLGVGQGTEQQRVHHAEHRRVRSDSDRQRCRDHQRHHRILAQHAQGITQILQGRVHETSYRIEE